MIPNLMRKIFLFFASLTIGSASMVSCTDLSEETYSVIPSDKFFNDEEEFLMSAEYIMAGIAEALTKGGANDGI